MKTKFIVPIIFIFIVNVASALTIYEKTRFDGNDITNISTTFSSTGVFQVVPEASVSEPVPYWQMTNEVQSASNSLYVTFSRWRPATDYSRLSDTSFVTTSEISIGYPVRYRDSGDWKYGVVYSQQNSTSYIHGIALTTSNDNYLEIGLPEMVRSLTYHEPGQIEEVYDFGTSYFWTRGDAYVVQCSAKLGTAPSGAVPSVRFNVGIGANDHYLFTTPNYLELPDTNIKVYNGFINIDTYCIQTGDRIYINVTQVGSVVNGSDLLCIMEIVTP